MGRNSVGVDVDPLSVFVSRVKAQALQGRRLEDTVDEASAIARKLARSPEQRAKLAVNDLTDAEYVDQLGQSWVPQIPNLDHWFYRYAIVDLATLLRRIEELDVPGTHRDFLRLVFAAIIRGSSRADPVPVSGLEVTKLMLEKEKAGRFVDVSRLFEQRLHQAAKDVEAFSKAKHRGATVKVYRADASSLSDALCPRIDAAISSPPYHGAVDYYRRHQLEMYWLGLTGNHAERLSLLEHYLGRPKVPQRHAFVRGTGLEIAGIEKIEMRMRKVSPERADAFKHYAVGMSRAIVNVAKRLECGRPFVLVVGHTSWNGAAIDTSSLMEELASPYFTLSERLWYPVKNRYMSYTRKNGANIDREYVLVLRRTATSVS